MFSPPNLKEEILDVLAPVSIISVFTVQRQVQIIYAGFVVPLVGGRSWRGLHKDNAHSSPRNHIRHRSIEARSNTTTLALPQYNI